MSTVSEWCEKRALRSSSAFPLWFLTMLAFCLLGGGCHTITPQPEQFPQPPTVLMQPPATLKPLPGDPGTPVPARQAAQTVAENYGLYHEVAEQLRALQAWILGQQSVN